MMMRPINIELWPTEAPKAFRNFANFCLEGYYHRNLSMGMNLYNISKMLRCTSIDDVITLKVDDGSDAVIFMFDSPNQDKIADFEMKLMDIDSEHLGIPEAEYHAIVKMPSAEFARICKDLSSIGDTGMMVVNGHHLH